MTAPLTPPDCDLRDFGFMPLDVRRFRDSDLVALEDPEAIVAALMLWGAAWHQVPAASLPDDDKVLAQLAGYGRAVSEFQKVKAGALRGFVKCSDGRLYHPVVASKAAEAWTGKLKQRWRTFCATIRKHNERNPAMQIDAPEYDRWLNLDRPDKVAQILLEPPREPELELDDGKMSQATNGNVTRDKSESHAKVTPDKASKGQGQGQGQGDSKTPPKPPANSAAEDDADDLLGLTSRICRAAGVSVIQPSKLARAMDVVKIWKRDGIDEELILDVIAKRLLDMGDDVAASLQYFDGPIRKRVALDTQKSKRPGTTPDLNIPDTDDARVVTLRDKLKRDLGKRTYEGWLSPRTTAILVNGSSVTLKASTPFLADWIGQHIGPQLNAQAKAIFGDVDVKVTAA